MEHQQAQTKWAQFISLVIVFFFWGFVAASNDMLIPVFKKWFVLSQVQAQLVMWAFYAAYFIGSLIFFLISLKSDVLQKFGYKKTLAFGLVLSAIGAFLFIPAAASANFWFFLTALFTVGLGFSVQQIVANPLAIRMGSADTGAHRLTLAGAVNSLGTTIGPILVGIALFGMGDRKEVPKNLTKTEIVTSSYTAQRDDLKTNLTDLTATNNVPAEVKQAISTKLTGYINSLDQDLAQMSALGTMNETEIDAYDKKLAAQRLETSAITYPKEFVKSKLSMVKVPFIVLGIAFILVAIFMVFSKIEDPAKEEDEKIDAGDAKFSLMKYPQLVLGMLAIFVYVGVEVTIISNLPALLHTKEFGTVLESSVAPFISLYWGSLMIGRWNGGVNVFNTSKTLNMILKFVVPFIAFAIIIVANTMSGKDVSAFYIYPVWIVLFILISFLGGKNAGKTLVIFAVSGILMMILGLVYPDRDIAKYFFISGGLFCSTMWPAIFDLAIAGLGKNTGKASSFLIMMILGGGIIPLIQGWLCDFDKSHPDGIFGMSYTHFSYIIPLLGFIYLAFYGYITPKLLRKQGVTLQSDTANAH